MGLTVLDAGVVIGFLDGSDAHHAKAHVAMSAALARADHLVLPSSALAEALVGPSRGGAGAVKIVRDLVVRVPIVIAPLDEDTAVAAASLRARHRALRLPDAFVIATAEMLDADQLITTDHGWPPRSRLGLRATITKL